MARYLLDTNIVLFFLFNRNELEREILDLLKDYNNRLYISTASMQEIIYMYEHNDPVDHIIISQAITERITLISSDQKFEDYIPQKLDFIFNSR